MKTDKEMAKEMATCVIALVGLLQPATKEEFDKAMNIAAMLIEKQLQEHVEQHLNASKAAANGAMEGK